MDRITQMLRAVRDVVGNERAVANAARLLDQRRFEDRVVLALASRITETTTRAA